MFVFSLAVIKVELLALQITISLNYLPLSFPQLCNCLILFIQLFLQHPYSILIPGVGHSQHGEFVVFLFQGLLYFINAARPEGLNRASVEIQLGLGDVVFFVVERRYVEWIGFGCNLNHMVGVWSGISELAFVILLQLLFAVLFGGG